jgi:uncharacterized cupredoxin-like copper-binding protein
MLDEDAGVQVLGVFMSAAVYFFPEGSFGDAIMSKDGTLHVHWGTGVVPIQNNRDTLFHEYISK